MNLKIDFWDVGQGDASVVTLPDGRLSLIDTGDRTSPLTAWLGQHPQKRIYALVITHNHEDHAGALCQILEKCKGRIEHVFFNQSRHATNPFEKELLNRICRGAHRNEFSVHRLEIDGHSKIKSIYGKRYEDDLMIYACHPDTLTALGQQTKASPNPNHVSAIVCLDINGSTEIIWSGDAHMRTIGKVCRDKEPFLIVGPHHGGPEDRKLKSYPATFGQIKPENVLVSVGTNNPHQHPIKKDFMDRHLQRGRRLICTQLNHCDQKCKNEQRHIIDTSIALGLLPPNNPNRVSCRGAMSLSWNTKNNAWNWDQWHDLHQQRVKNLEHPYCLRSSFPAGT